MLNLSKDLYRVLSRERVPIAWFMLVRYPFRLLTSLAGIVFAGILVLVQLSIQDSLYVSSVSLFNKLNADIVIVSPSTVSLLEMSLFPSERLVTPLMLGSVEDIYPLAKVNLRWRIPSASQIRFISVLGINPSKPTFIDRDIERQRLLLLNQDHALIDALSRPEFGVSKARRDLGEGRESPFFINSHTMSNKISIVGLFKLGSSFAYESTLITSQDTLSSLYPDTQGRVSMGLVKLKPGYAANRVVGPLNGMLPPDVIALTKDEFIAIEKSFWAKGKPIGFVFLFSSIMGLAVGSMMVYQVLSSDVSYHMESYALMICLGYRRRDLESIVFMEALILSALSFPGSWLVSYLISQLISTFTSLPVAISSTALICTFLLILAMCMSSALFAMVRLRDADPSVLFS